jgi:hypothetical protein
MQARLQQLQSLQPHLSVRLHIDTTFAGLNTVDSGGAQIVKTLAITQYAFTAKGTGIVMQCQGIWDLRGANTLVGNGMTFSVSLGTDNPYYSGSVGYGFQMFNVATKRYTVTKGSLLTPNVIYQAMGDGGINGSLFIKHMIIHHFP